MLQINFSNSFDKTKSFTVNGYVVFQFYPWFKFNFPFFQTHYHTLSYPKKNNIYTKDKIEPQQLQHPRYLTFISG